VCSVQSQERDMEIRREIQATLRNDVQNLMRGEREECSRLLGLIGRTCLIPRAAELSRGYQDPFDVYARLLQIFAYSPIWFHQKRSYGKLQPDGMSAQRLCTDTHEFTYQMEASNFVLVDMDGLYASHSPDPDYPQRVDLQNAWRPEKWEPVEYSADTVITCGNQTFRYPHLPNLKFMFQYFDHADVLVARIFRGPPPRGDREDPETFEESKEEFMKPIQVPENVILQPLNFQGESVERVAQRVGNQARRFTDFQKQPRNYRLLSAVIYDVDTPHYITLLKVPTPKTAQVASDSWYLYDDNQQSPYRSISDAEAQNLLTQKSVLLFYFPFGPPLPPAPAPAPSVPSMPSVPARASISETKKKYKSERERRRALEGQMPTGREEQLLFSEMGKSLEIEKMSSFHHRVNAIVNELSAMSFDPSQLENAATDVVLTQRYRGLKHDLEATLERLI